MQQNYIGMDDNIDLGDGPCPKCESDTRSRACDYCEDGVSSHDCGDDTCCCLNPMLNTRCDDCDGS